MIPNPASRSLPNLSLLLLAGAAPAQDPVKEPAKPDPPSVRFAWPVPGKVTVTETTLKKGRTAKMRYVVHLAEGEDGKFRVSLRDFEFLSLNGIDATRPGLRKQLAPALALAMAIPDLVVSKRGVYLKIEGYETMLNRVLAFVAKQKGEDDGTMARIRKALSTPQMSKMLQAACGNFWATWVGAWSDWDVPAGKKREGDSEVPLGNAVLPARFVASNLGAVADAPGHEHLRIVTTAKGESAKRAFLEMMRGLAKAAGGEKIPEDAISDIRGVMTVEVITDPRTLRPRWARAEKKFQVTAKGQANPSEQHERREYRFEWPAK